MSRSDRQSVDALLTAARAKLHRVPPHTAAAVIKAGGLLVDIRPIDQRQHCGEVPDALIIGRNVLEWRLDPASPHRVPQAHSYDQPIVIMCAEGYSSSFAAAALQDLGLTAATDLIGGYQAWKDAGLPTRPVSKRRALHQRLRAVLRTAPANRNRITQAAGTHRRYASRWRALPRDPRQSATTLGRRVCSPLDGSAAVT